jgi:hypothetical protein
LYLLRARVRKKKKSGISKATRVCALCTYLLRARAVSAGRVEVGGQIAPLLARVVTPVFFLLLSEKKDDNKK